MKSASAGMIAHLKQDCTTLCRLYKITRKDGLVFTFTDHDKDIDTVGFESYIGDNDGNPSIGGYIYLAAVGFSPTASQNKSDLTVDNQEATCFIDNASIKEEEVRYGFWDAAAVEIRIVNWADLTDGAVKIRKGYLGNISMKNGLLTAEMLGLTNQLQILSGRTYGTSCDAELGDGRCQAVVPVENGTVNTSPSVGLNDPHHITPYSGLTGSGSIGGGLITVANPQGGNEAPLTPGTGTYSGGTVDIINAASLNGATSYVYALTSGVAPVHGQSITITGMGITADNGTFIIGSSVPSSGGSTSFYTDGFVTFTGGINSGLSFQVKDWDGITLTLWTQLFAAPANGDPFKISPGCAHNVFDCKFKFNNLPNHRGFPTIPGMDSILNYPNATG